MKHPLDSWVRGMVARMLSGSGKKEAESLHPEDLALSYNLLVKECW